MKLSALLTAMILLVGMAADSEANHRKTSWTGQHVGGVHNGTNDELYCVDQNGTGLNITTAITNVTKAIWSESRPAGEKWDAISWDSGAGDFRVWFVERGNCDTLNSSERAAVDIEYFLWNNTGGGGCINPSSCVNNWSDSWDEGNGHLEYFHVRVNLYGPYTVGTAGPANYYRHQVNHETGHVLGLKDPDYTGHCPVDSVMHSLAYGCSQDRQWPSSYDVSSVKTIAEE